MKYGITTMFFIILFGTSALAQEECIQMIDTVVTVRETSFRVKRIPDAVFDSLAAIHYVKPETCIKDFKAVEKMLAPEFQFLYDTVYYEGNEDYCYLLKEIRRKGKYRYLIGESDGFVGFYPKQRILMYFGGHSSDQAICIDTGEDAWNPEYAALSPDGRFRLTGLHTGQESVDYQIEYKPSGKKGTQKFELLAMLNEVTQQIPIEDIGYTYFVFIPFWVDGVLYFQTGGEFAYGSWGERRCVAMAPKASF